MVTGGAGAIGSNLVIALSELLGDDGMIIVLDNLSAIKGDDPIDFPPLSNVMFVTGDVRSDIDLKRVIRERPTIIYHLAAFFANQNSVDYPETSADVDINGMIKLLDLSQFTNELLHPDDFDTDLYADYKNRMENFLYYIRLDSLNIVRYMREYESTFNDVFVAWCKSLIS